MSRVLSKRSSKNMLFAAAIICMLVALIRLPEQSVSAARDGVDLCLNVILPSLFPFFVLSTICVELGLIGSVGRLLEKIMYPLFRVSGCCAGAFLMGIIGGYPVGAKTAIELYRKGQCSRQETERMLSFCNNSGPAFILGVVGAGIFSSSRAGLWLYGAHVAASVLVGVLFRFYGTAERDTERKKVSPPSPERLSAVFTASVQQAFSSTLGICGFVIFFTVLIRLLFYSGVIYHCARVLTFLLQGIGMKQQWAEALLTGAIEMTSGVWSLRDMAGAMGDKLCMAAFILGWAGLSVHCQVLSFIGSSGLSTRTYFLGKLLHGGISAGIIYGLSRVLGWNVPVAEYLVSEVSTIASLDFARAFQVSAVTAMAVWLVLTMIWFCRKNCGKAERHRV